MAIYASNIIKQAEAWLDRKESDGSHKEIIDTYNSHKPLARGYTVKYTDAWCSTFVSAVAIKCGATDIIPTECGCEKHIQLFKNIGAWVEDENRVPAAGDIIFYDWEDNGVGDNRGSANHVGIVQKVVGSTIHVIEGNYSNAVGIRKIAVNAKYIRGYGVPKYNKKITVKKSVDTLAKEVIAGKWDTGDARRDALTAAGYNYDAVQAKVNELLGATKTTVTSTIVKGDTVTIKDGAKTYDGKSLAAFVYRRQYKVSEVSGDRIVIKFGSVVIAAMNKKDLVKV